MVTNLALAPISCPTQMDPPHRTWRLRPLVYVERSLKEMTGALFSKVWKSRKTNPHPPPTLETQINLVFEMFLIWNASKKVPVFYYLNKMLLSKGKSNSALSDKQINKIVISSIVLILKVWYIFLVYMLFKYPRKIDIGKSCM